MCNEIDNFGELREHWLTVKVGQKIVLWLTLKVCAGREKLTLANREKKIIV
jgi:hypothetical protein